ncbi:MAG: SufE family protein [Gammaproteobacteria bacterium]|nr:SufE family protein [Gammaproteobacteria bacterium]
MTTTEELLENFELLGDWEERYRYLIDLGRQLPALDPADRNEANRVEGCMSNVWLKGGFDDGSPSRLHLEADSDAHITKGIAALLRELYQGRTRKEVEQLDIRDLFERIGLVEHLSPTRQNGLHSMVERIKSLAGQ